MHVNVIIGTEQEEADYIDACARIRHISRSELLRRILTRSIKDQMVGAILDDIIWKDNLDER